MTEEPPRESEIFSRLVRDLGASLELDVVLQRVADAAKELCGADVARIALRRPGRPSLVFHYWAGAVDPSQQTFIIEPGQGVGGQVLLTGRPFRTDDYRNDPRISRHFVDVVVAERIGAVMAVPIQVPSRLEGVLFVDRREAGGFTDADESVLSRLADHAAVAIRNARLYGDLQAAMANLQTTQRRVLETERLRALGTLASGMAHHLNNLLAVMLGRVEMLLRRGTDPAMGRALEIVRQAGVDSAEIVRRVSRFVEVYPVADPQPVDLNQVIGEAVELASPRGRDEAGPGAIDVSVSAGPIPLIDGDPFALREALLNLLGNALDAMPGGGSLAIRTWAADGQVWCALTDTGEGMSDDTRRQVLDPFFTTKGPHRRGLGLSVVYGILQRHGGGFSIESTEGAGTTVVLHLPADDDHGTAPPAATT